MARSPPPRNGERATVRPRRHPELLLHHPRRGDFWVDYDLGRSWTRFTATVGLDDRSRASATATYTILADTTPVATGRLTIGQAVPIDVPPVTGALRLRLKINDPPSTLTSSCDYNTWAKVVWGNPTLIP